MILPTDQWLKKHYHEPLKLMDYLKEYFPGATKEGIFRYLVKHGMYHQPVIDRHQLIQQFRKNNVWETIKREKLVLQKIWNGPNIPICILPSDSTNRELRKFYHYKAGLAFKDKLFLFIHPRNSVNEIRALFTHEYNHVCRLVHDSKKESDYTLLDTIILEGMAENAVRERLGTPFLAPWTKFYSPKEIRQLWKTIISSALDIPANDKKHQQLLYGSTFYPKMAGYAVGYEIVKTYMKFKNCSSAELLTTPATDIAAIFLKNPDFVPLLHDRLSVEAIFSDSSYQF